MIVALAVCTSGAICEMPSMPRRFLSAEWRHLVMLNYAIDPEILAPLVPPGTELDSWGGTTFVSMVGFMFLRTRLLGFPIPFHQDFEEVNLRFYVRREAEGEVRRGVVFVKEIVPKWAVSAVARWVYNENYEAFPMDSRIQLPDAPSGRKGEIDYGWGKRPARNSIRAEFDGVPEFPDVGSEEEFITEHYWGYARQKNGPALEYRVEHPQWKVWRATSAKFECDVERCYGPSYCAALAAEPTSAFIADGSEVSVYRGVRISS